MRLDCKHYPIQKFYDEEISSSKNPRMHAKKLINFLGQLSSEDLKERINSSEAAIKALGISFTVYSDAGNIDRQWPLDIIPRIICSKEWKNIDKGLVQRFAARSRGESSG